MTMTSDIVRRMATDVPMLAMRYLMAMAASNSASLGEHRQWDPSRVEEAKAKYRKPMQVSGGIARIEASGVLMKDPSLWDYFDGAADSGHIRNQLEQAAEDASIKGVLLSINSPGGFSIGGAEMADQVARLKREKAIVSHIDGIGASLAYYLASQSTEIVANASSIVGSIGTFSAIPDASRFWESVGIKWQVFTNAEGDLKAAGLMGNQLSESQAKSIQDGVDAAHSMFRSSVISGRPKVTSDSMRGQTFIAGVDGKSRGLVDRIGSEKFAMDVLKSMI